MRIAHVVTRMNRGGCERNVAHFANWQVEHGHDVVVIAGPRPDESLLPPGARVAVLPHLVREPSPRRDRRAIAELRELLEAERCEVVHTHQSKAGVVGRLLRHPEERVIVHTVHMPSFGPAYGRKSLVFRALEQRCARRTDLIVAVGQELREMYVAAGVGSPSRYRVLRSPVDLDAFTSLRDATPREREAARRRLGLQPSLPTILAVGSLEPRKRHGLAMTALHPLLQAGRAQLLVAGAGPERASLEALAGELGVQRRVHLVGHLHDVATAFAAGDVMVHTSATEGVPQVVLQSLAAGVPVVATPVPGVREIGTSSAVLVDGSGIDLADRVRSILEDPPDPCDLEALAPWRAANVEKGIARLHEEIASLLRDKRTRAHSAGRDRARPIRTGTQRTRPARSVA